jgi:hypothetical protein
MRRRTRTVGGVLVMLFVAACGQGQPPATPWPAPSDAMQRANAAGLEPTKQELLNTHTHAHLDIFIDGRPVTVPAGIGIDIRAQGVKENPTEDGKAKQYQVLTCDVPCLSPLHTHDPSGTLHTESVEFNQAPYSLGQFFTEWGVKLDASCVGDYCRDETKIAVYLNGTEHDGNPAEITLDSHAEIAIVIGDPPSTIPHDYAFRAGE